MSEMTKLCKEFKQVENVMLIVGCAMFTAVALVLLYFAGWWIFTHWKSAGIMVGFYVAWAAFMILKQKYT